MAHHVLVKVGYALTKFINVAPLLGSLKNPVTMSHHDGVCVCT